MPEVQYDRVRRFFVYFNRLLHNDQAESFFLAVVVGSLVGLGGFYFREFIFFVRDLSFSGVETAQDLTHRAWYWVVLPPAIGGLLVGLVAHMAKEVRGHGVSGIIENMVVRGGRIRKRLVLWGTLASGISIGTGGSCGKEGPIVQIGSGVGATVSSWLNLNRQKTKTLIGCGAAAGIAGVFNAPIGGSLFALEVILGDFALATFSPIIVAAVASTVVSRALAGNNREILVPEYQLEHFTELFFYALLGIAAGIIAIFFIKMLNQTETWVQKIALPKKLSSVGLSLFPMLGGFIVGMIGLRYPQIFGPWTYETIDLAVSGKILLGSALVLALVKVVATSITLGSGGSGGVFAPSLFIGALLGSSFGSFVNRISPETTAEPGAYAVVGMAALVAGTTQAPLSAIMILFELTDSYTIILPLMVACIISAVFVRQVNKESIYTERLAQKGINVRAGRDINVLKNLAVADAMVAKVQTLKETMTFGELLELLPEFRHITSFPVINSRGEMSGILSFSDFQSSVFEEGLKDLVIVKDLATRDVLTVFPDQNLEEALKKIGIKDVAHIPVVDRINPKKVIGILSRRDIISAYNKALLKYNF